MTLQTWKDEFYQTAPSLLMTEKEAIEHSLKKWIGLTENNLQKHQVWKRQDTIRCGSEIFKIASFSCSLCVKYWDTGIYLCSECPLYKTLGMACDSRYENERPPYVKWVIDGDPLPMIQALTVTLENAQ